MSVQNNAPHRLIGHQLIELKENSAPHKEITDVAEQKRLNDAREAGIEEQSLHERALAM